MIARQWGFTLLLPHATFPFLHLHVHVQNNSIAVVQVSGVSIWGEGCFNAVMLENAFGMTV